MSDLEDLEAFSLDQNLSEEPAHGVGYASRSSFQRMKANGSRTRKGGLGWAAASKRADAKLRKFSWEDGE